METLQERQERIATRQERIASAPARRIEAIKTLVAALKKRGYTTRLVDFRKTDSDWSAFKISIDNESVEVMCKIGSLGQLRFVIGAYHRNRLKKQFPEPMAGFDYTKIVTAVEAEARFTSEQTQLKKTRDDHEKKATAELKRLLRDRPKLKAYERYVDVTDTGGFNVELRCTTIAQVEGLLSVALASKVEA